MGKSKYNGVVKVFKIIGVAGMIAVLIVGVGVAWGDLTARVANNEKDITEIKSELRTIGEGVAELLRRTDE